MRFRGETFWRGLVGEVAGGKKVVEVAARHGVSASSILRWRAKLSSSSKLTGNESTALIPVRVSGRAMPRLEVRVGEVALSFEEGTEPSYIAALVSALGA